MLRKINKIRSFAALIMCLSSANLLGQAIVNIEELRREGEIGFFTNISAGLDASRGNRDRDYYKLRIRFDNNSEDAESFLIMQQTERKSNDNVIDKSKFIHGRYILIGEDALHWEVFAQYSENPFRNYKKRSVLGGGLRFELSESGRLGAGLLNEEETDLTGQAKTTERLGFYLHTDFDIAENISFDPTIYFQPSIENFENDYKASMILALDFKVNENFKIRMQYSSFHDSDPPMLAEKTDDSISTMFSYDLSKLWKD
jgi:putative salt-induced outer membrane protein YdiY